jgi:hypothetical protein
MSSAIQKEAMEFLPEMVLFYKCPNGGFASLRPGTCPKCHERLTPVVVVDDADRQSSDGG